MKKLLSLIAMWFLFSTTICLAGEAEEKVFAQVLPLTIVVDSSAGLIEGRKHLAAIIRDESQSSIALAVLELDQAGSYKLRSKSEWWIEHSRWYDTSVKIKNNSVYFSLRGSGGCCSDYLNQYQFKPQDGKFTLIGTESSQNGFEPESDDNGMAIDEKYISYNYGTSINYLTSVVSYWRTQAPSSSTPFKDDISTIKGGKKRVEKRLNFVPAKKVFLDGFDIWAEDPDGQVKHLGGFFDQSFKFHE